MKDKNDYIEAAQQIIIALGLPKARHKERKQTRMPVEIAPGQQITLSPGGHSQLIRALMKRYLSEIAWETEVWAADAPSHLIHYDGVRFLGPYPNED